MINKSSCIYILIQVNLFGDLKYCSHSFAKKNHDGKGTCNNKIFQIFKFTNKLVWLVIMWSLDVHEIKIFMKFLVQSFEINMFCLNPFHNRVDEMGQVKIVDKILPKFDMKFIYSCRSNYMQMIIFICIITWWNLWSL